MNLKILIWEEKKLPGYRRGPVLHEKQHFLWTLRLFNILGNANKAKLAQVLDNLANIASERQVKAPCRDWLHTDLVG